MSLANTVLKHSIVGIHSYLLTTESASDNYVERNFPSTIYSY